MELADYLIFVFLFILILLITVILNPPEQLVRYFTGKEKEKKKPEPPHAPPRGD
jgi:hypothetical protein